jgi:L-lactate dehydrogenase complex protein LldF
LPFASTLCGACRDICPVRIDIPRLLLHLRWKENLGIGAPRVEFPQDGDRARSGMRHFAAIARRPRLMRFMLRVGAFLARPFARDGYFRRIPGPFRGWTRGRDFPALRGR